jgi:hypothetical protein
MMKLGCGGVVGGLVCMRWGAPDLVSACVHVSHGGRLRNGGTGLKGFKL